MANLFHRIDINASPEAVYQAVATEKGMRGWWTRDTKMDGRVGGKAEFGFDNRGMVFHMAIDALEPNKLVRMSCSGDHPEWAGTKLEWRIEPDGDKTYIDFHHNGWAQVTPFAATCNSTWGELMHRLKSFVETGKANPHWDK